MTNAHACSFQRGYLGTNEIFCGCRCGATQPDGTASCTGGIRAAWRPRLQPGIAVSSIERLTTVHCRGRNPIIPIITAQFFVCLFLSVRYSIDNTVGSVSKSLVTSLRGSLADHRTHRTTATECAELCLRLCVKERTRNTLYQLRDTKGSTKGQ